MMKRALDAEEPAFLGGGLQQISHNLQGGAKMSKAIQMIMVVFASAFLLAAGCAEKPKAGEAGMAPGAEAGKGAGAGVGKPDWETSRSPSRNRPPSRTSTSTSTNRSSRTSQGDAESERRVAEEERREEDPGRGTLRRAWDERVQPGFGRPPGLGREELPRPPGDRLEARLDGFVRRGEAALRTAVGGLLGEEPARPLRCRDEVAGPG